MYRDLFLELHCFTNRESNFYITNQILQSSDFNGCLELFFIGIPIIIAIILTRKDDKLSILLTNINKFQKGEQVQMQIRHFLELVDQKDSHRNSKIILKGYIYLYEDFCTLPECALKKYITGNLFIDLQDSKVIRTTWLFSTNTLRPFIKMGSRSSLTVQL